jgi:hypothetical protein
VSEHILTGMHDGGQPDPTVEPEHGTLLRLAGQYVRESLDFPGELATLRTLVAELLFEQAMLRARIERLERAQ